MPLASYVVAFTGAEDYVDIDIGTSEIVSLHCGVSLSDDLGPVVVNFKFVGGSTYRVMPSAPFIGRVSVLVLYGSSFPSTVRRAVAAFNGSQEYSNVTWAATPSGQCTVFPGIEFDGVAIQPATLSNVTSTGCRVQLTATGYNNVVWLAIVDRLAVLPLP